jgi:hypothetical protein
MTAVLAPKIVVILQPDVHIKSSIVTIMTSVLMIAVYPALDVCIPQLAVMIKMLVPKIFVMAF